MSEGQMNTIALVCVSVYFKVDKGPTKKFARKRKLQFQVEVNPSSPKGGGLYHPPNGFRPGAQNRIAKG